jgi:hypothetical protein
MQRLDGRGRTVHRWNTLFGGPRALLLLYYLFPIEEIAAEQLVLPLRAGVGRTRLATVFFRNS